MTAQEIAQSFESFAIDHKPEGWPAVQQKELSEAAAMLRKQADRIEALERENAELRKYAERYRWLRDQNADLEAGFYVGNETDDTEPGDITWVGGDLDDAIDAAMQKEQS